MASIGDFFFNKVLGQGDPAKELQAVLAQQGSTHGQPVPTHAGAAGGGATAAPGAASGTPDLAAAQQGKANAYQSPPDLIQLYTKLMERQENVARFDRSVGLIAAGFASPENRGNIINAMSGGSSAGGQDPGNFIKTIMDMQAQQAEQQNYQRMMATVPMIAKQYGLDETTAMFLAQNGELDAVIKELEKPNNEIVTFADGTKGIIDKTTGTTTRTFGPATPKAYTPMTGGDGTVIGFDPQNPAASVPVPGTARPPEPVKQQSITLADGTVVPFNPETGGYGAPFGPQTPQEPVRQQTVTLADGTVVPFNPATGGFGAPFGPQEQPDQPTEVREYEYYVKQETDQGRQPDPYEVWRLRGKKAAAPSVSQTNNAAGPKMTTEIIESLSADIPKQLEAVRGAKGLIGSTENARRALNQGIIAGDLTSPAVVEGRKLFANLFGIEDQDTINSDTFMATMQDVVADRLKSYGAGNSITDKDREYVQKSVGASLVLNEQTITNALNIQQRVARNQIVKFNERMQRIVANIPEEERGAIGAMLQMEPIRETIPPAAIEELMRNPTPQEIKEFDDAFGLGVGQYIVNGGV